MYDIFYALGQESVHPAKIPLRSMNWGIPKVNIYKCAKCI